MAYSHNDKADFMTRRHETGLIKSMHSDSGYTSIMTVQHATIFSIRPVKVSSYAHAPAYNITTTHIISSAMDVIDVTMF